MGKLGAEMRTWELEVGGYQKVLVGEWERGLGNWRWDKREPWGDPMKDGDQYWSINRHLIEKAGEGILGLFLGVAGLGLGV